MSHEIIKNIFVTADRCVIVCHAPGNIQPQIFHEEEYGPLTELLRNAARFAPDGRTTLAYTLISHKKRIAFTVTDRGPGIPAAEADRIFDRFVKLDPFSQGMGLGLAVCRLIADALGGGVELDTSYTEGARFTLTIPIV